MRDIRFRVWDTKNKEYVDKIAPLSQWLDTDEWDDAEDLLEDPYIYPKLVTPTFDNRFIWEQFTGLKDSDDQDIYEGDLLKLGIGDSYPNLLVNFSSGCFWLGLQPLYQSVRFSKISGNIHEPKS